ncbi:MAG: hypothetical protein ACXVJ7_17045 [Acidimicrobiia bacterium]
MVSSGRIGSRGAVIALLLVVGVAACGGGSSSKGVASLSGNSSKAAAKKGSSTSQASFRTQLLAYAKCMRDNGVDFPDPQFDANGRPQFNRNGQGFVIRRDDPTVQKAQQACRSKRPDFAGQFQRTPAELAATRKSLLKYAACMRSKGVDFPDPTFDSSGRPQFGQGNGPGFRDQNRNDPQFQSASDACRKAVGGQFGRGFGGGPRPGGGGGPGGGTSSNTSNS